MTYASILLALERAQPPTEVGIRAELTRMGFTCAKLHPYLLRLERGRQVKRERVPCSECGTKRVHWLRVANARPFSEPRHGPGGAPISRA